MRGRERGVRWAEAGCTGVGVIRRVAYVHLFRGAYVAKALQPALKIVHSGARCKVCKAKLLLPIGTRCVVQRWPLK